MLAAPPRACLQGLRDLRGTGLPPAPSPASVSPACLFSEAAATPSGDGGRNVMAQFPGFRVTHQGQPSFVSENAESILSPSPDGLTEGRFLGAPRGHSLGPGALLGRRACGAARKCCPLISPASRREAGTPGVWEGRTDRWTEGGKESVTLGSQPLAPTPTVPYSVSLM